MVGLGSHHGIDEWDHKDPPWWTWFIPCIAFPFFPFEFFFCTYSNFLLFSKLLISC